jgi:STE24 endopeptidase
MLDGPTPPGTVIGVMAAFRLVEAATAALAVVLLAYAVGPATMVAIAVAASLAIRVKTARFVADSTQLPGDSEWPQLVAELAGRAGLERTPPVLLSDKAGPAQVVTTRRPVILIGPAAAKLSRDELAAVIAHEVGHLERGHRRQQLVAALIALGGVLAVLRATEPVIAAIVSPLLAVLGLVVVAVVAGMLALLLPAPLNQLCELDADRAALELGADPRDLVGALEKLDHSPDTVFTRLLGTHPSVARRRSLLLPG